METKAQEAIEINGVHYAAENIDWHTYKGIIEDQRRENERLRGLLAQAADLLEPERKKELMKRLLHAVRG